MGEPQPSAQGAFTDRVPESEAFGRAASGHFGCVHRGETTFRDPYRNVLVFRGIGGIGKTELSGRLERWASGRLQPGERAGWGPPPRSPARS